MAGLVAEPAFGTGCAHGWSLGSPEMPPDPGCGPARCGLMGTQQSKGTFFFSVVRYDGINAREQTAE